MIEILKFKEGNASNRPFLFLRRFAEGKKPKNKKRQGRKAIAQFYSALPCASPLRGYRDNSFRMNYSDAEIQDFRHFYLIHDLCRGLKLQSSTTIKFTLNGALDRIRTCDLSLRRRMCYLFKSLAYRVVFYGKWLFTALFCNGSRFYFTAISVRLNQFNNINLCLVQGAIYVLNLHVFGHQAK